MPQATRTGVALDLGQQIDRVPRSHRCCHEARLRCCHARPDPAPESACPSQASALRGPERGSVGQHTGFQQGRRHRTEALSISNAASTAHPAHDHRRPGARGTEAVPLRRVAAARVPSHRGFDAEGPCPWQLHSNLPQSHTFPIPPRVFKTEVSTRRPERPAASSVSIASSSLCLGRRLSPRPARAAPRPVLRSLLRAPLPRPPPRVACCCSLIKSSRDLLSLSSTF